MKRKPDPVDNVNEWRLAQSPPVTIQSLCEFVGDAGGGLFHWFGGSRPTLSMYMLVQLSETTGLPIEKICTPKQSALLKRLFAVMARDAALSTGWR